MLPNESFLQVLHFADYKTLVLTKLAGRCFRRLATKYAAKLACRHSFHVTVNTSYISYSDVTIGDRLRTIENGRVYEPSLEAACRELDKAIGPHAVNNLAFYGNTWNMPGVGVIFEASPPLKYAEDVELYSPYGSANGNNSEPFMSHFAGIKSLRLGISFNLFRQFKRTLLHPESSRNLRLIKVGPGLSALSADVQNSIEELARSCVTLPRMSGGEPLELDFSGLLLWSIRQANYRGKTLKGTGAELTFRMRTYRDDDELMLDESDYMVHTDGTTKRYTSEDNGIVVEVSGRSITIQSTDRDPY
ncbi:hypothetical protein AAVH_24170 [Aphelenchoides avenae]|nr:hypothetical protein AAVH_24170 [Aphelenchus avenae]